MAAENVHIFGIRHHGPGSARSLRQALETLQPDAILVEGPPDAAAVLPLLVHAEMQPPVALLIYAAEEPSRAAYYPFAIFSPEWQALQYGLSRGVTVRFMDLPQAYQFALAVPAGGAEAVPVIEEGAPEPTAEPDAPVPADEEETLPAPHQDPLGWLARAAGYGDGERWWEHMVEERRQSTDLFAAILEAMAALREAAPPSNDPLEALREAHMRQAIRAAEREGFMRIAVVCGAWHAPVLAERGPAREDAALLRGLPKAKVQATWIPWTYGRLARASGYGAGIASPGWYHHLWSVPDEVAIRWLARVAQLLRAEGLDASTAHVIEALRLAESLAALRDRPLPGLAELNEAVLAVFASGSEIPLRLIHEQLVVGETLGRVPDQTPQVPLEQDVRREQRRLRLAPDASERSLDLDLRQATDLDRSHLLHRLSLLGIPWGVLQPAARAKGTFHELWRLRWQPEFAVALIEAGIWGNTLPEAAAARARDIAERAQDLPTLTTLLDQLLLADLADASADVMARLQAQAAVTSDVAHLMSALPPLATILRYGNVRRTDAGMVAHVVDGLVARICIGLPGACASLDDDAAGAMLQRLLRVHEALVTLRNPEHLAAWQSVLAQMAGQEGLHGLLAGRCVRLLLDAGAFTPEETSRRLGLALSRASEPARAADWIEGFLRGSALVLLHDPTLWQLLDDWVAALSRESFTQVLPLLRRIFATFPAAERRQMGERARRGNAGVRAPVEEAEAFDAGRAEAVLPLAARLLGLALPEEIR